MKKGKKYTEAAKLVDRNAKYSLIEACELVTKTSTTKFDATVEAAFRLNLDPTKAEQNLRGAIVLPNGTGKTRRILVITRGAKVQEALDNGADYAGEVEYINKIQQGWFDFDVIVATPDMMGQLGRLGRVLGPKGLMPNPKTGTVTTDVAGAIKDIKNGKVEYRCDKAGNIQVPFGKVSFGAEKLAENFKAIYSVLVKSRPNTVKGEYVNGISVSTTMGPGVKVDPSQAL
jgi:large subunit ribosomal protein L1